jgi:hypothetical protein
MQEGVLVLLKDVKGAAIDHRSRHIWPWRGQLVALEGAHKDWIEPVLDRKGYHPIIWRIIAMADKHDLAGHEFLLPRSFQD